MTNLLLKFIPCVVMTICLATTTASAQTTSALLASAVGASGAAAISVTATDYNQITDKALLFPN
jgi:nitrate/nitrite transporter NarK